MIVSKLLQRVRKWNEKTGWERRIFLRAGHERNSCTHRFLVLSVLAWRGRKHQERDRRGTWVRWVWPIITTQQNNIFGNLRESKLLILDEFSTLITNITMNNLDRVSFSFVLWEIVGYYMSSLCGYTDYLKKNVWRYRKVSLIVDRSNINQKPELVKK